MMRGAVAPAVAKEVRALLPVWGACAVAVAASGLTGDGTIIAAGSLVYALGLLALGAQSMGHEYSHRTLGTLLTQPATRHRLFWTKAAVLVSMLLSLTVLGWIVAPSWEAAGRPRLWDDPAVPLAFAAGALLVTPFLTMLCRSALAGAIFTTAIPACVFFAADVTGTALYGVAGHADIDRFRMTVFWPAMAVYLAAGGVLSWWMFHRLEAVESTGADIQFPAWGPSREGEASASRVVRHPVWLLVKKELRLQQITFVVAAMFVVLWAAAWLSGRLGYEGLGEAGAPVGMTFALLIAFLCGSLASAEERHLGTREWQQLLPMAAWQQWMVKAGTVLALALTLGAGIFTMLLYISEGRIAVGLSASGLRQGVFAIVLLTSGSLYVSSLSTSGIRAVAMSLPVAVGASVLLPRLFDIVDTGMYYVVSRSAAFVPSRADVRSIDAATGLVITSTGVIIVLVLLGFAHVNHWSSERPPLRIAAQVVCIIGGCLLAYVAIVGVPLLYYLT